MNRLKYWIIGGNLLLLLLFVNRSVVQKEQTLSRGTLILMELAPVDPRSLMQGDYMDLRYAAANRLPGPLPAARGFMVVTVDGHGAATPVRLQLDRTPLKAGEHLIRYFSNNETIRIGAESYFFQEGRAERFARSRFGGLRVDSRGNNVLVGLYDSSYRYIVP